MVTRFRPPARAWLRPLAALVGGLALAALFTVLDQLVLAVPLALIALLMAYWTSPLRRNPHQPWAEASAQRVDDMAVVIWAPGDPLSARMQTAIRSQRTDVLWVNAYQDPQAAEILAEHGGREALPLVFVGEEVKTAATVGELLDLQEAARARKSTED
jgi:hypothetical protein